MIEGYIRLMDHSELKGYYRNIKKDFPAGEYPPYFVLHKQMKSGLQQGLVYCIGDRDVAYAICASGHTNNCVLLSYFAVLPEHRGENIGTTFLKDINLFYSDKKAIYAEVERPDVADSDEEFRVRNRRIGFYERAGYVMIPALDYSIWDVPMYLMVCPISQGFDVSAGNTARVVREMYSELLGKTFIHKVVFR